LNPHRTSSAKHSETPNDKPFFPSSLKAHRLARQFRQPPIDILINRPLDLALVCDVDRLALLLATLGAKAAVVVHSALQGVAFPAEDVVAWRFYG